MKHLTFFSCLAGTLALAGTISSSALAQTNASPDGAAGLEPLLQKQFVLDVLQHIYRWHFDQSYVLDPGKLDTIEVWARRVHPRLDSGDHSEFAELWIPAVSTQVELKRSDYKVPELNLDVVDHSFKVTRVTRQTRPPAERSSYHVGNYALSEVRDYLFDTRANRVPMSDNLRKAVRMLIAQYLDKAHPAPFTEDQILYVAPVSTVCNDLWAFWETGRKIMLFGADMDLSNPGFAELSQLRLQVIDLDKDVVASTKEVPGSNAFVTKDWVGRLFFNCILYGERIQRTPEEIRRYRANPAARPPPR